MAQNGHYFNSNNKFSTFKYTLAVWLVRILNKFIETPITKLNQFLLPYFGDTKPFVILNEIFLNLVLFTIPIENNRFSSRKFYVKSERIFCISSIANEQIDRIYDYPSGVATLLKPPECLISRIRSFHSFVDDPSR